MYLRTTQQKRADGRVVTHYQFAESIWSPEKGRSVTRIVYNFGRADDPAVVERLRQLARSILRRCSPDELTSACPDWRVVDAWPYGDVYVLDKLWRRLGIDRVIEKFCADRQFGFSVERALFAMVANRAIEPASKLYCYEQWLRADVRFEGFDALDLQHLYRAMDFLERNKDGIEQEVFFATSDLLKLDVDLIFYDTTSLHFELDEPDTAPDDSGVVTGSKAAGAKQYAPVRQRGYSKNGRDDVPQIVIGLAVTRDGLPVRHWIFPGNTVDVTTVAKVKEDLRGWKLGRCVFVGDAGMVSKENLRTLSLGGGKYIVAMPVHRGGEVELEVLSRAGRYKQVADNLAVKEVEVGDGERRRRYVVCHNPQEAERQSKHRQQVLREVEAELASLADCDGDHHNKRACKLLASGRYGKYLRQGARGWPVVDRRKVAEAERTDGKYIVHSNDDTLSAEDLALGYKQLMRVEQAWRTLKSGLRMRPVYHHAVHRIHAHVALSVLALLLERVAERDCGDTWRNIRDDLRQVKLALLKSPHGEVWQVTEPDEAALKRLKSLKIDNPPVILEAR
jgi:hypothetical protein